MEMIFLVPNDAVVSDTCDTDCTVPQLVLCHILEHPQTKQSTILYNGK
jgi:hypothetical protein